MDLGGCDPSAGRGLGVPAKGEVLDESAGTLSVGCARPLGVVASFTPWNGANVLSWRAGHFTRAAGEHGPSSRQSSRPVIAGIMVAEVAEELGFLQK